MTPKQLAEVRARDSHIHDSNRHTVSVAAKDRRALLAHVDALTAERDKPCVWTVSQIASSKSPIRYMIPGCEPDFEMYDRPYDHYCGLCGHRIEAQP